VTGRALFALVVDEEAARVAGVPVERLNTLLAILTAVVVVAAMRVVGVLLVAALMVLPVGASQQLARSFKGTVALAVGIGVASVILGLAAARVWGLAAGGAIVLVASIGFAATSAAGAIWRSTRGPRRVVVPPLR
jgi:zinc transport system permease protein